MLVSGGNRVLDLDFRVSKRQAKLALVDKQPDNDIVHLDGAGKADRLAY
jgi:hypothetical protein